MSLTPASIQGQHKGKLGALVCLSYCLAKQCLSLAACKNEPVFPHTVASKGYFVWSYAVHGIKGPSASAPRNFIRLPPTQDFLSTCNTKSKPENVPEHILTAKPIFTLFARRQDIARVCSGSTDPLLLFPFHPRQENADSLRCSTIVRRGNISRSLGLKFSFLASLKS